MLKIQEDSTIISQYKLFTEKYTLIFKYIFNIYISINFEIDSEIFKFVKHPRDLAIILILEENYSVENCVSFSFTIKKKKKNRMKRDYKIARLYDTV